ncbi:MAG: trehalose-phosphatase [Candidatus Omnitrophica bacterium]|nr:trehalose-phosphatase [Candidatus Omnitrophota bacterium]
MKDILLSWGGVKKEIAGKHLLLFLDYDGTLAPIARTPGEAVLSKEVKGLLRGLSTSPYCSLGIISGRALGSIKKAVGIKGIIYAGNHGLEIEGPEFKFTVPLSPRFRSALRDISGKLRKRLSGIKGVLMEDKGLTLSIHYRLAGRKDIPAFERAVSEVTRPYAARGSVGIDHGKKVYEIKPPIQWDKGKAVLWLMARRQFASGGKGVLPVYIGDDVTDEDAFKALKRRGLTVFVGERRASRADYRLKNTGEVAKFLRLISALKRE